MIITVTGLISANTAMMTEKTPIMHGLSLWIWAVNSIPAQTGVGHNSRHKKIHAQISTQLPSALMKQTSTNIGIATFALASAQETKNTLLSTVIINNAKT